MKELSKIREITREPEGLFARRRKAYERYIELPPPSPKEEEWRYSVIPKISFEELGSQEIKFNMPEEARKEGVIFTDIRTAIREHYDLLSNYMPMTLIGERDKFSAIHSAFWNDGVFIYVPKNIKIGLPLKNKFIAKEGGVFSHTLIILEENSSIIYAEEHYSAGECFRSDAAEIFLKPSSSIGFYSLHSRDEKTIGISNWKAVLEDNSRIDWVFGCFGSRFSRVKVDTLFKGKGSEATKSGMFYGKGEQHFDISSNAYHLARNTSCNILIKGVQDGKSSSVFRGKIKIEKEAQQTNSYLSDHRLMLSDDANSNSIPSLEIDANDVKASHGATLGKPDEDDIFYLMARGLKRDIAEKLIIRGFFSDVLDKIGDHLLRKKFNLLLERPI